MATKAKANGTEHEAESKRKRRGEGPIKIEYLTVDMDVDAKPTSTGIVAFRPKNSENAIKFSVADLPSETVYALAVEMVAKKVDTYVRNHFDPDENNTEQLIEQKLTDIRAGKLFTRAAGKSGEGGRGRKVDVTPIIEALRRTYEKRKKPLTDDQLQSAEAQLKALTAKERSAKITEWKKDPIFKMALLQVTLEASKAEVKKAAEDVDLLAGL